MAVVVSSRKRVAEKIRSLREIERKIKKAYHLRVVLVIFPKNKKILDQVKKLERTIFEGVSQESK